MGSKIAIITPCYNVQPELIHNHFFSIRKQGAILKDVLHVVVDDCSTNADTRAALLYNADKDKDYTVLISSKQNSGPGAARNRAIDLINKHPNKFDYVCLLDADDYLEKDSLQFRRNALDESDAIAVYGDKYTAKYEFTKDVIDNQFVLQETSKVLEVVPDFDKRRLFEECYIPSCSMMFRFKPFSEFISSFREDVRLCEDWLIWRKLSCLGRFRKINMPIYTQTLHGKNLTTDKEVLGNHLKDMITTKADLEMWIEDNMDIIKL